jgi:uncharacterized protein YodC (DUF2158 family)
MVDNFQVGDTVQLKSGGPWMTIDHIGSRVQGGTSDEALCSWFEKNKAKQQRNTDWFKLTSLKKVNQNEESAFYPSNPIMRG